MDFELTKEQRDFQRVVHDFVAQEVRPLAKHVDETGEFNWQAVKKMGPMGMLGLQVPEDYGGAELDTVCATIAVEELGWALRLDGTWPSRRTTAWARVRWSILPSDELKQAWLPHAGDGQGPPGLPGPDRAGRRFRPARRRADGRPARRRYLGRSTVPKCGPPTPVLPTPSSCSAAPTPTAAAAA